MRPKLSFLVVTSKSSEELARTLTSLEPLNRDTNLTWELVLIDGFLKENGDTVRNCGIQDQIQHLPISMNNPFPAWNLGIEQARGDYVAFWRAGDALSDPSGLILAINEIDLAPEIDILFSSSSTALGVRPKKVPLQKNLLRGTLGVHRILLPSCIYRRQKILKLIPFSLEFALVGDYEFHLRAWIARLATMPSAGEFLRTARVQTLYSRQAFSEFRGVQRHLAEQLPFWFNFLNPLVWWVEEKKRRLLNAYQSFSKFWE